MASIRKEGKYHVLDYTGVDRNGKTIRRRERFLTRSDAKIRKAEIELQQAKAYFTVPTTQTLNEFLNDYIQIRGREKWSPGTMTSVTTLFDNYVRPFLGRKKMSRISPRMFDEYFANLRLTPLIIQPKNGPMKYVTDTIRQRIYMYLHAAFNQAVKWDVIGANPLNKVDKPSVESHRPPIWSDNTFFNSIDQSDDPLFVLWGHVDFSCSTRVGEALGLTWDCVHIDPNQLDQSWIMINKQLQRIPYQTLGLPHADVYQIFPSARQDPKTVLVLKKTKTAGSTRRIFLPTTVAMMMLDWREIQELQKQTHKDEYTDYGLVFASEYGQPIERSYLQKRLDALSKRTGAQRITTHALRSASITYKLKLTHGNVKAVQGDSGHTTTAMVTDCYARILDEDRVHTAQLMEQAYYEPVQESNTMLSSDVSNIQAQLQDLLGRITLEDLLTLQQQKKVQ